MVDLKYESVQDEEPQPERSANETQVKLTLKIYRKKAKIIQNQL
jgi:hypothetical protein